MKRHAEQGNPRTGSITQRLIVIFDRSPELLFIPYYAIFFWLDIFGLRAVSRSLEDNQVLGLGLTLVLLLLALLIGAILVAPAFLGGYRPGGTTGRGLRAYASFIGTYMVLGCSVSVIRQHRLAFYPGLHPRGWLGYLVIPLAGCAGFALAAYLGTVWRRRRERLSGLRAHRTRAVG